MILSPGSKISPKVKAAATSGKPVHSIAILPFINRDGDKGRKSCEERMFLPVRYALTHIPGLEVAGRVSTDYWHGKGMEPVEIGKKLGVENILEGSVRREGNRLSVKARLINVSDGSLLWSESYDRDLSGLSSIQDDILKAIADIYR